MTKRKNKVENFCVTDGIITAVFDKEANTLTFSGNGAVYRSDYWLPENDRGRSWKKFVREIIFESGITSIGSTQFTDLNEYCNLEKVVFQGDISSIGERAFCDNPNLTTVEFGGKCRRIETDAFRRCYSLEHCNVPVSCSVACDAFNETLVLVK